MSEAAFCFWKGCHALGIDTQGFEQAAGLDGLDITKETVVYGGIGTVRRAFDRLGVKQPTVGEMPPPEVLIFYGRRIWATTMLEVREGYEDNKFFFIKPLREHKGLIQLLWGHFNLQGRYRSRFGSSVRLLQQAWRTLCCHPVKSSSRWSNHREPCFAPPN